MDKNHVLQSLFSVPRVLIGAIHVDALPGTPNNRLSVAEIAEIAAREARIYQAAGFHGLIIENMHDRPYLKGGVGPEIGAAMAVIGAEVRRTCPLPLGVQVLAGANNWAVAVAHACGAAFVRVEGFVFAHVAARGSSNPAPERCSDTGGRSAPAACVYLPISRKSILHMRSRQTSISSRRRGPRSSSKPME